MIGASLFLGGSVKAEVDYQGIAYLGGGDKIDLNNANIRAYLKVPGFYPSIASKIVVNGPFKTVQDIYNIPGLTETQKDIIKKSESRFLALDVKPEYEIDKINNGYVTHTHFFQITFPALLSLPLFLLLVRFEALVI